MKVYQLETLDEIPQASVRLAVLGHPIAHSRSPAFQGAALKACGLDGNYVAIETRREELAPVVHELKARGFRGWNCTLPLKIDMLDLVDARDDSARNLQAVNTVLHENGKLTGFNTDGPGWVEAVREAFGVHVSDLRVMILGAGGAGRALAIQAALEKCKSLVLVNRSAAKAQELADQLKSRFGSGSNKPTSLPWDENAIKNALRDIDLLVNATSVGLQPSEPPVLPEHVLRPGLLVYDTIYRPAPTPLVATAQRVGCKAVNGLGMLLHQGAAAFTIWTGRPAPLDVMRAELEKA